MGDTLIGGLGNDWLDGGTGNDVMKGGAGDDIYIVDSASDVVIENAGEGIDTIQSSVSRVLGANVENLILTGMAGIGTGNSLDNMLTGNIGNNTLDGGLGADTMAGGAGNDIYIVDNIGDVVIENVGEGIDTIQTALNYALTDTSVENLWLTGTAAINGTGNALDNTLRGDLNTAANVLAGGLGNDTYNIDGTDIVIENAGGGIDTVIIADWAVQSYTLGANLENLTMGNGSAAPARTAVGNALDNIITLINKNGSSDVIDGGAGADTMSAGFADDTYYVDNVGDVVIENVGEGDDTIFSTVSYNMANALNVENITLVGSNLVATGTALNNTYTINDASNTVVEAVGGGTDTIITSLGSYTLGNTIENLVMTGEDASSGNATIGTGNALDNKIDGISSYFFRPASVLTGGLGNDRYVADVWDTIVENAGEGVDTVYLNPIAFWAMGTVLDYTIAANVENLSFDTYLINGFSYAANVIGNAENNVITIECSSAVSDVINGGLGADTMSGGYGNDTYYVDNVGDIVIEGSTSSLYAWPGVDTIISSINYSLVDTDGAGTDGGNVENLTLSGVANLNATGNVLDNVLTGNAGNNILVGSLGNDTYVIQNAGDIVIENAGEGTDTVVSSISYTLAANVENITLTGADAINATGNELDNVIRGSNNINGYSNTGANVLTGGLGNDTYYIDGTDTIIENAGEGIDSVVIGEGAGLTGYTLGANLENLSINVPRFTPTAVVTGNELNNVIAIVDSTFNGEASNDILDGGLGADTMNGSYGADTYIVDNVGDVVIETDATYTGGIDTVKSSVSYALATNVENMILTGVAAINATGNELNNVLTGNSANNLLSGGLGNDTLTGNAGNDVLEGADGNDTMSDTAGNNLFNGGAGTDTMTGSAGNELFVGGLGNDTITTGTGADIIAFNKGDGVDTVVASTGADNTLSLGGGINYAGLTLSKSGANLILGTGNGDQITLQNWYTGTTNHSVANLQLVLDATTYNAGSADVLLNQQVQSFDFALLAQNFDAALLATPTLSAWSLSNALLTAHLSGSNTAALGGDLAYQYNLNGSLAGVGLAAAQTELANAGFGTTAQTLQPLATLQTGTARLG
jgi:Ca2+-binding RTX toxin-like protein